MGKLFIRMPDGTWDPVSLGMSGPAGRGTLKVRMKDGTWINHIPPATNLIPLRIRIRPFADLFGEPYWEDVLYLGQPTENYLTTFTNYELGVGGPTGILQSRVGSDFPPALYDGVSGWTYPNAVSSRVWFAETETLWMMDANDNLTHTCIDLGLIGRMVPSNYVVTRGVLTVSGASSWNDADNIYIPPGAESDPSLWPGLTSLVMSKWAKFHAEFNIGIPVQKVRLADSYVPPNGIPITTYYPAHPDEVAWLVRFDDTDQGVLQDLFEHHGYGDRRGINTFAYPPGTGGATLFQSTWGFNWQFHGSELVGDRYIVFTTYVDPLGFPARVPGSPVNWAYEWGADYIQIDLYGYTR